MKCNKCYQLIPKKEEIEDRIREKQGCQFHSNCSADCRYKKGGWLKKNRPTKDDK